MQGQDSASQNTQTTQVEQELISVPTYGKKSKKQIVGIVILSLIAIAGVAFGVYGVIDSNSKSQEIAQLKAQLELLAKETGAEVIEQEDKIVVSTETIDNKTAQVDDIIKKIHNSLVNNRNNTGLRYDPLIFGDGSYIVIPGTDIGTFSNQSYSLYITDDDFEHNYEPYVQSILVENGYTKVESKLSYLGTNVYYNKDDKIYCTVPDNTVSRSDREQINCSSENWIDNDDKQLILDLAKASDRKYISASVDGIKNSSVAPYQTLNANLLGAAGLFYRVSPDSDWVFFADTQGLLPCDKYTGDAAKAYAGDTCYDESTNEVITIQP